MRAAPQPVTAEVSYTFGVAREPPSESVPGTSCLSNGRRHCFILVSKGSFGTGPSTHENHIIMSIAPSGSCNIIHHPSAHVHSECQQPLWGRLWIRASELGGVMAPCSSNAANVTFLQSMYSERLQQPKDPCLQQVVELIGWVTNAQNSSSPSTMRVLAAEIFFLLVAFLVCRFKDRVRHHG